ncbi:unnamed protein product, partial [Rotaria magnacalcarata]
IDLFRELDVSNNTTNDDQLRIECRSITYLNKSSHILSSPLKKLIQSTEYCLDRLVLPPFSILSASLIGIGYKEESIKYVMKKYNTTNIYFIDRILREETQDIDEIYQQEQQQKRRDVLIRLSPYDENGALSMLIGTDDVTTDLSISTLRSEIDNDDDDDIPSDKKWFYETVRSVGIRDKLDDWHRDQTKNNEVTTVGYPGYELVDLAKADCRETEFTNKFKNTMTTKSHYVHRQIPRKIYMHSRTVCAYGLIASYARYTILNMLKGWCNDDHSRLFPLSKFGDGNSIVNLLRWMDHHHTHARMFIDETINRMEVLIMSIIKVELKDLLICVVNEKLIVEIFNRKAPVIFQLQKLAVEESIHFLSEPSLIDVNNNNEQIFTKQPNLDLLLKIFHLFSNVLKDFTMKNYDVDLVIRLLFPGVVIKILFDLFLLVPSHRLKTFIIGLFTNTSLAETADSSGTSEVNIKFDIVKASLTEHPEDTMFYQAYKQLYCDASRTFRRSADEQVWTANYVGMFSNDQGGPYRDSVTRICADLCSTRLPLFILCPNGRTNDGLNRDRWIPNVFPPNRSIPVDIKNQYRFVGQLMGMAIRTKLYLDVRFPILLWKQLIHEEVTIEDIEAIDISSFAILNEMEENIRKVKSLNECDDDDVKSNCNCSFSSVMTEITFDVVSSTGQTYELIPGGFHIPITAANFEDYCMRYRQYRINEFYRQIEFIRQGLFSVVPRAYLTLFTAYELEETVCGKGFIDIQMLKRHTDYRKDDESSPRIQRFWSVLSEMFSEELRKLFLIFVWGRSTLPYRDEDFSTNFVITHLETSGNVDEALPRSYTCSFTLQLPAYSTKEIMYERLNYAITYCSSIDTDRRMN